MRVAFMMIYIDEYFYHITDLVIMCSLKEKQAIMTAAWQITASDHATDRERTN